MKEVFTVLFIISLYAGFTIAAKLGVEAATNISIFSMVK